MEYTQLEMCLINALGYRVGDPVAHSLIERYRNNKKRFDKEINTKEEYKTEYSPVESCLLHVAGYKDEGKAQDLILRFRKYVRLIKEMDMNEDHKEGAMQALFGADRSYDSLPDDHKEHVQLVAGIKAAVPAISYAEIIAILKAICASGVPSTAVTTLCTIVNAL